MSNTKQVLDEFDIVTLDNINETQLNNLVIDLNAAKGEEPVDFTMKDFGEAKDHVGRVKIIKERFGIKDDNPVNVEKPQSGTWNQVLRNDGKVDPNNINVTFNENKQGGKRRSRKRRSSKKKRKNKKSKKSRKAKKSRKSRK